MLCAFAYVSVVGMIMINVYVHLCYCIYVYFEFMREDHTQ